MFGLKRLLHTQGWAFQFNAFWCSMFKNKRYFDLFRAAKLFLARSLLNLDNLAISSLSTVSFGSIQVF